MPVRRLPVPARGLPDAWSRFGRPRIGSVDVVHSTSPIVPPTRRALVATIHDVAFRHDPSQFTRRGVRLFEAGLTVLLDRAAAVLCSSSGTLNDCLDIGFEESRCHLVPLGVRVEETTGEEIDAARRRYGLPLEYLLAVGTREPRKNLNRLAAAHGSVVDAPPLVVAGPAGWGEVDLPRSDRLHLLGRVSDDERRALYAGARALCYPSLREGFGLPVLEALAQGSAVLTSEHSAMAEYAGSVAVLVDPRSTESIAEGIRRVLEVSPANRQAGRAIAETMTWRRTAELTASIYREVAR
jgi:glycosyltransferase involved in cell wall biosynthesis